MLLQRADGVRRAAGVVTAGRGQRGGDEPLVEADRGHQHPDRGRRSADRDVGSTGGCGHRDRTRRNADRRSRASSSLLAVAAAGKARTTIEEPGGSSVSRGRTCSRSRRVTRCRTTLLPTGEETTKPARAGSADRESTGPSEAAGVDSGSTDGAVSRWRARCRVPARRPVRSTAVNSAGLVTRIAFDSTGSTPGSSSRTAVRAGGLCRPSGRQFLAALRTTGRQDGATRTGPHPQAETVGLGPTPVVRLKSTLAHDNVSRFTSGTWCLSGADGERGQPTGARYARAPDRGYGPTLPPVKARAPCESSVTRSTGRPHRSGGSEPRVRPGRDPGDGCACTSETRPRDGGVVADAEGSPAALIGPAIPRSPGPERPLWERLACC